MGNNSVPKFIFRLSRFPLYRGSVLDGFYCMYIYIYIYNLFIVIMSLWINCLCLLRCYSLDPVPLKLYVHNQWTRDLMRQIDLIDRNIVITIAIDGTNAFKALMYWWKHKEKHSFSRCSMTGKVARCVQSDWKCCRLRVQWRAMCGVLSGWRCTIHEWQVFCISCSGSGSVVQLLLSGWKCAVHVELLEMYSACWIAGYVRCLLSDWESRTVRVQWLEIYSSCRLAGNIQSVCSNCKRFTVHTDWQEMYSAWLVAGNLHCCRVAGNVVQCSVNHQHT